MQKFSELDRAEIVLGKPVTAMSDTDLVSYFKLQLKLRHDIDLAVDGQPERAVMAALRRVYGPSQAGRIVKWACWHHNAARGGEPIGFFAFAKKMKWFTDRLHTELQRHDRHHDQQQGPQSGFIDGGFAALKDL